MVPPWSSSCNQPVLGVYDTAALNERKTEVVKIMTRVIILYDHTNFFLEHIEHGKT